MKKQKLALIYMLSASMMMSMTACGTSQNTAETTQVSKNAEEYAAEASKAEADSTYTGTVSSIDEDSITLDTESGEVTIPLTESTTFGFEAGMNGMGQPPAGEAPDASKDNGNDNNQPPADAGAAKDVGVTDGAGAAKDTYGGQGFQPDSNNAPPEKTDSNGPAADKQGRNNTPPERPDGEQPDNIEQKNAAPSEKTDNSGAASAQDMNQSPEPPAITISDISEGDTVTVVTDADGNAASITLSMNNAGGMQQPGGPGNGGPGGMSQGVESYDAATEFTSNTSESDGTYTSTASDENAVHVYNGASVTLKNAEISRDSDSSTGGDNSSFYGVGAAALVTDGNLNISSSSITTDAAGGAGVFAYGDGTAYVSDSTITTNQDTSGGIHAAGGGTLYAWNLNVDTKGESSAAIRSDRGGGMMVVDGGTYTSNGTGSPAIYSTANIAVNDAALTANGSEAICIEGLNSIRLFDCDLTGSMKDLSQNDCTWNVILYQSMSGDSEVGNSTFEMVGGSLTAKNGGMFYTTNTESTFILSDVDINYADDNAFFLKCTGNSNQRGWGTAGSNGADCNFTAIKQDMQGDVIWDSISQLDYYMLKGSKLTGAIVQDESNAGNGGSGYANVYIDADSSWIVTGDSTVSTLHCAGKITDASGKTVTIKGTDGTVYVQGNSSYTITADSYDTDVDTSGAQSLDSWSDFAVEKANA